MSVLSYLDIEPSGMADFDTIVEAGASSIVQAADAAFGERGSMGLRATVTGSSAAYVYKTGMAQAIAYGGTVEVGFWIKIAAYPSGAGPALLRFYNDGAQMTAQVIISSSGYLTLYVFQDDSSTKSVNSSYPLPLNSWTYVAVRIVRATAPGANDGGGTIWVNGRLACLIINADNDVRCDDWNEARLGVCAYATAGQWVADIDEVKLAAGEYPQPYLPPASSEYVCPERTIVLYDAGTADGREFADYCCQQLGIPLACRCRMYPSYAEAVGSYGMFQMELEDPLIAWMALNTDVADQCCAILVGYRVAGGFQVGATFLSGPSRLMRLDHAFSQQSDNPFYAPETISRLTAAEIRAEGCWIATRIDADTLQHAKDIIDLGISFTVEADDKLYSDDAAYKASLNCQHLRIETAALAEYANDAIAWGDTGSPAFGAAGSRILFADDSAGAAGSLRTGTIACRSALLAGYAAALGSMSTVDGMDVETAIEMLRIGGTLGEAFLASVEHLDYMAMPVGVPWATVGFQVAGYNIYQGVDAAGVLGDACIDYDSPVAYGRAGITPAELVGLCPLEYTDYWFGVRAVSNGGVEEINTTICAYARIEAGVLVGLPPNAIPADRTWAEAAAGGKVRLHASYNAQGSLGAASGIQVASVVAGVPDWDNLLQTIAISGSARLDVLLDDSFADGATIRLAIRAVTASGRTGRHALLDPVVADATAPPAVDYVEAKQSV